VRFQDKIAIVTGASRGIGRAIALTLAREGADIVGCARNEESFGRIADEIEKLGRRVLPMKADVSESKDVERLVGETIRTFGRVDILVNNAGIHSVRFFTEISDEEWDRMIAVNVRGVFLCSREVAKQMIKQGEGGKIVNIASMAGKLGIADSAHYCASKFAVIGLTQSAAMDLAKYGINVNAVCPGLVETDMFKSLVQTRANLTNRGLEQIRKDYLASIPLGRFAGPDEIAEIVVFLCSEKADYMTGQAINMTGGWITH